jgi:membrane protein DedA with SNARE-associated domain
MPITAGSIERGNRNLMDSSTYWVTHYGYGGIFVLLMLGIVGIPIPDESLLAFAGYLVSKGELQLLPTLAVALLAVCAASP